MATNRVRKDGYHLSVVCSHPTTPVTGGPVRYGRLTGVALTDEAEGGNPTGYTSVDFGPSVWDLVVDDNEGSGIAVGDVIYYHDTGTGTGSVNLNNSATGNDAVFGIALEVVSANATTLINVLHLPAEVATVIASGAIDTAQLADGAVETAKIEDGNVTVAKLSTAAQGSVDGLGFLRVARFTFDPSANAGERTIAAHGLGVTIPDNAIILGGGVEILTTFASADDSGTIALHIQSANDLITATAISSGTFWDAVAYKGIVPTALELGGVATAIKLSAAREITATVGTQALTAGKLVGWLIYVIGA